MSKRVRPAALQLDVVVDLFDHLLELPRVHTIRAHSLSPVCRLGGNAQSVANAVPTSVRFLLLCFFAMRMQGEFKERCEKNRKQ